MKDRREGSVIGFLALVVALFASGAGPALAQPLFSTAHDPVAGARLFVDKGCASCHAVKGKGGKVGPDLAHVTRPRTFYDLAAALWNHSVPMAARMRQRGIPRPQLTASEAGNLAAYLFTLNYFDRPGNPQAGRRLLTDKRCLACHQVEGEGGALGPRLEAFKGGASPIALAAALWRHGPRMMVAMEAKGIDRPALSGAEIADIIAYLNRNVPGPLPGAVHVLPGRPAEGQRLLTEKRCLECHSVSGRGEGALNLAEREADKSVTEFAAAMWNKLPRMLEAMKARGISAEPLRPDEMADIVAYLYAARYFAQAGDPRNGVILATYKGCLGCHALYSERGKPASELTASRRLAEPASAIAALWNHAFIADPRPPKERAPWFTFTGPEMADLLAYLRSLQRSP